MQRRPSWSAFLVCFCLLLLAAPAFAGSDSLARCDSLLAENQFAAAESCLRSALAEVDSLGEGNSLFAGEVLARLLRAHLSAGGRLDPSCPQLVERLLLLTRSLKGPEHPDTVAAMLLSGQVAERFGNYVAARGNYEQVLAARSAAGWPEDADLAKCLIFLANAKARLGDMAGLDDLYEKALAVVTETEGPETLLVTKVLANYAIYKKRMGDLVGAGELYDRTLKIQIRLNGEDHLDVARTYYNLGNLMVEKGDYPAARADYLKSLDIRERILGPDSSDVARSLTGLALLEKRAADLLQAREYAERAVAIQQRLLPPLHPVTAEALATLATIRSDLGDLESAREILEDVLPAYEKAFGPNNLQGGQIMAEMGLLRQLAGDWPGALEDYRRAEIIYEASDPENDRVAGLLSVHALLLADMGRTREARAMATRSLARREEQLEPTHPARGRSLATLGRCLWQEGNLVGADSLLCRSLGILGPIQEDHFPAYLAARFDLARVRRSRGAISGALDLALAVECGRREALRLTVRGLPERLALIHVDRWPNGLDLAVTMATESQLPPPAIGRIWTEIIRSRALVLDAMAWRCRMTYGPADASTDTLLAALARATRELAGLLVGGPQDASREDLKDQSRDLRRQREQIEQELWLQHPSVLDAARAETVTLAEVAAVLPKDAALVGFFRFERHLRAVVTDTLSDSGKFTDPAYAAFVLSVGRQDPVLVDLGPAQEIDRLVRVWRDEAGSGRQVPGRDAATASAACRRAGIALRQRIWDPLGPHLQGAGTVQIVPDGSLNLVNFDALPSGEDRFLIDENQKIVPLGIERDLVDRPATRPVPGELLAFGAPDFSGSLAPFEFAPLPASADEVGAITALWREWRSGPADDGSVLALLGTEASEAAFKKLAPGFRALHVATHGFYLADGFPRPLPGQRGVGGLKVVGGVDGGNDFQANPMLRSGLVLTSDESPTRVGGEDGILTAAEISVLDLGGVDWVVLSACESGMGEILAGEGVFGLRRAFRIAGAKDLVISLWPLGDDLIRDWMLQLYQAHFSGRLDLVSATREASWAVLASRRGAGLDTHPQTWAGFIACGD